jgi:hypothetical protein
LPMIAQLRGGLIILRTASVTVGMIDAVGGWASALEGVPDDTIAESDFWGCIKPGLFMGENER